jgi:lipoprotein-anchoring transpeptidase ErfK/SrfK
MGIMRDHRNTRAALLAGLSLGVLLAALPAAATELSGDQPLYPRGYGRSWSFGKGFGTFDSRKAVDVPAKKARKPESKADAQVEKKAAQIAQSIPPGPLHIIVSIDAQRVTLYANGAPFAHAPVSSGTTSHPTPMGLFTIIQKNRHHISNLYDASMPYMQRITWSGSAMHQGPLPGYPASHGCVRLPHEFAAMLWKATKIGARVIITRPEVAPVEIEHAQLFTPTAKPMAETRTAPPRVKTADGATVVPGATVPDANKDLPAAPAAAGGEAPGQPVPAQVAAPRTVKPFADERANLAEASASRKDATRRASPVSVFISRKDGKLYVRQGMEPVFDVPIAIRNPEQPIGTHVYTAMELKNGGATMRWTAVSIPSGYPRDHVAIAKPDKKAGKKAPPLPAAHHDPAPTASEALDRIELTQDMREQIGQLLSPGSSLIVSDNALSSETGPRYTDFIVLTR